MAESNSLYSDRPEPPLGLAHPLLPSQTIGVNSQFLRPLGARSLGILDASLFTQQHFQDDSTSDLFDDSSFFPPTFPSETTIQSKRDLSSAAPSLPMSASSSIAASRSSEIENAQTQQSVTNFQKVESFISETNNDVADNEQLSAVSPNSNSFVSKLPPSDVLLRSSEQTITQSPENLSAKSPTQGDRALQTTPALTVQLSEQSPNWTQSEQPATVAAETSSSVEVPAYRNVNSVTPTPEQNASLQRQELQKQEVSIQASPQEQAVASIPSSERSNIPSKISPSSLEFSSPASSDPSLQTGISESKPSPTRATPLQPIEAFSEVVSSADSQVTRSSVEGREQGTRDTRNILQAGAESVQRAEKQLETWVSSPLTESSPENTKSTFAESNLTDVQLVESKTSEFQTGEPEVDHTPTVQQSNSVQVDTSELNQSNNIQSKTSEFQAGESEIEHTPTVQQSNSVQVDASELDHSNNQEISPGKPTNFSSPIQELNSTSDLRSTNQPTTIQSFIQSAITQPIVSESSSAFYSTTEPVPTESIQSKVNQPVQPNSNEAIVAAPEQIKRLPNENDASRDTSELVQLKLDSVIQSQPTITESTTPDAIQLKIAASTQPTSTETITPELNLIQSSTNEAVDHTADTADLSQNSSRFVITSASQFELSSIQSDAETIAPITTESSLIQPSQSELVETKQDSVQSTVQPTSIESTVSPSQIAEVNETEAVIQQRSPAEPSNSVEVAINLAAQPNSITEDDSKNYINSLSSSQPNEPFPIAHKPTFQQPSIQLSSDSFNASSLSEFQSTSEAPSSSLTGRLKDASDIFIGQISDLSLAESVPVQGRSNVDPETEINSRVANLDTGISDEVNVPPPIPKVEVTSSNSAESLQRQSTSELASSSEGETSESTPSEPVQPSTESSTPEGLQSGSLPSVSQSTSLETELQAFPSASSLSANSPSSFSQSHSQSEPEPTPQPNSQPDLPLNTASKPFIHQWVSQATNFLSKAAGLLSVDPARIQNSAEKKSAKSEALSVEARSTESLDFPIAKQSIPETDLNQQPSSKQGFNSPIPEVDQRHEPTVQTSAGIASQGEVNELQGLQQSSGGIEVKALNDPELSNLVQPLRLNSPESVLSSPGSSELTPTTSMSWQEVPQVNLATSGAAETIDAGLIEKQIIPKTSPETARPRELPTQLTIQPASEIAQASDTSVLQSQSGTSNDSQLFEAITEPSHSPSPQTYIEPSIKPSTETATPDSDSLNAIASISPTLTSTTISSPTIAESTVSNNLVQASSNAPSIGGIDSNLVGSNSIDSPTSNSALDNSASELPISNFSSSLAATPNFQQVDHPSNQSTSSSQNSPFWLSSQQDSSTTFSEPIVKQQTSDALTELPTDTVQRAQSIPVATPIQTEFSSFEQINQQNSKQEFKQTNLEEQSDLSGSSESKVQPSSTHSSDRLLNKELSPQPKESQWGELTLQRSPQLEFNEKDSNSATSIQTELENQTSSEIQIEPKVSEEPKIQEKSEVSTESKGLSQPETSSIGTLSKLASSANSDASSQLDLKNSFTTADLTESTPIVALQVQQFQTNNLNSVQAKTNEPENEPEFSQPSFPTVQEPNSPNQASTIQSSQPASNPSYESRGHIPTGISPQAKTNEPENEPELSQPSFHQDAAQVQLTVQESDFPNQASTVQSSQPTYNQRHESTEKVLESFSPLGVGDEPKEIQPEPPKTTAQLEEAQLEKVQPPQINQIQPKFIQAKEPQTSVQSNQSQLEQLEQLDQIHSIDSSSSTQADVQSAQSIIQTDAQSKDRSTLVQTKSIYSDLDEDLDKDLGKPESSELIKSEPTQSEPVQSKSDQPLFSQPKSTQEQIQLESTTPRQLSNSEAVPVDRPQQSQPVDTKFSNNDRPQQSQPVDPEFSDSEFSNSDHPVFNSSQAESSTSELVQARYSPEKVAESELEKPEFVQLIQSETSQGYEPIGQASAGISLQETGNEPKGLQPKLVQPEPESAQSEPIQFRSIQSSSEQFESVKSEITESKSNSIQPELTQFETTKPESVQAFSYLPSLEVSASSDAELKKAPAVNSIQEISDSIAPSAVQAFSYPPSLEVSASSDAELKKAPAVNSIQEISDSIAPSIESSSQAFLPPTLTSDLPQSSTPIESSPIKETAIQDTSIQASSLSAIASDLPQSSIPIQPSSTNETVVNEAAVKDTSVNTNASPETSHSTPTDPVSVTSTPAISESEASPLPQVLQSLSVLNPLSISTIQPKRIEAEMIQRRSDRTNNQINQQPTNQQVRKQSKLPFEDSSPWSNFDNLVRGKTAPARRFSAPVSKVEETRIQPKPSDVTAMIQRSREGATVSSEPETEETERSYLDLIAQRIYSRLKQRLQIDQERHGKGYSGRLPW